jgi:hypothetical protein
MAPYFPCIQSSGMGKTKLLHEAHQGFKSRTTGGEKNSDTKDDDDMAMKKRKKGEKNIEKNDDSGNIQISSSALILCRTSNSSEKPSIYTHFLNVPQTPSLEARKFICEQLNSILLSENDRVANRKIVFLVDEAQHLLTNDAFGFRCVGWWLRRKDHLNTQVAAVFAGTSSGLANFYRDDITVTQYSRDPPSLYYESGTNLFEPFFDLCTIGVFVKRAPAPKDTKDDAVDAVDKDYAKAIPYGRPLFALLNQDGNLTKEVEEIILQRMTLSYHHQPSSHHYYCM